MARGFPQAMVVTVLWLGITAASNASSSGTGVLEGQVQVYLAQGTQLADDTSPHPKKVPCAEYPVVILSKDGRTQVAEAPVNGDGRFRIDLAPGDYLLDVKRQGGRRLHVDRRPFTVVAGQTVKVDLEIERALQPM